MPAWAGRMAQRLRGGVRFTLLLAALLVAAAILRWNGLDWDQGHIFHPDERHILMVTAGLHLPAPLSWAQLISPDSPLNPHSFAYGSLPFYLLKLVGQAFVSVGSLIPAFDFLRPFGDLDHLRLIGRVISGLFDLGSVVLVYLLGRKLRDGRVGLLAAAFLAFTVINVQYAHFYATDTMLSFLVLASMIGGVAIMRSGSWRATIVTGVLVGLAIGTKFSALPILAMVGTAHLLRLFTVEEAAGRGRWGSLQWRRPGTQELNRSLLAILLGLAVAAVVFVIVEPYALIDWPTFTRNLGEQNDMVRGIADLPYTRQYANTPPYWYFIWNLVLWGMGLPLGLIVVAGTLGAAVKTLLRPRQVELLLFSWVLPYFAITGAFHAKFLRYLLPLTPFLCLLAAYTLFALRDRWKNAADPTDHRRYHWAHPLVSALMVIGIMGGALYAIAFNNIYLSRHTAVQGSEWIYQNVLPGSHLMTEHWEEGMPVPLVMDGKAYDPGGMRYQMITFAGYDSDSPAKLNQLVQQLESADYIVFFSNRLYDTIPRLPERYPISSEYYQLLFGEQLGFRLEASFISDPSIFGVTLIEDTFGDPRLPVPAGLAAFHPTPLTLIPGKADESFSVYDHPKVLIFKKHEQLSETALRSLFAPALAQPPREPLGATAPRNAKSLLLEPAQRLAVAAGGTFRQMFDNDGLASHLPVPVWVVLVELIGLLGLPLSFAVFRRLPDRGYLLAKPLGILVLTWLDWILVSLGVLQNNRSTALLALFLLALIGAGFAYWQRSELRGFWRSHRSAILRWELLFWAAFAFFLLIRFANPDLWHPARGGEKPMDLAYLMAAIKSATFPPYDPWFAGGYLNYYYYGQVIVATLVKLSGIIPTTAYNLVVPLLFALTAGGAFSAAYNLAARGMDAPRHRTPWLAGLGAALSAVIFGNLGGAIQLISQIAQLGPPPIHSVLPGLEGISAFISGLWRLIVDHQAMPIGTDWYWASTRVLDGTINEFPFFTFLYADLHAHMIALPFVLLAVGLAIAVLKRKGAGEDADKSVEACEPVDDGMGSNGEPLGPATSIGEATSAAPIALCAPARAAPVVRIRTLASPGSTLLRVGIAGLVIGALLPINSWDFPTYFALYCGALVIRWYVRRPLQLSGLGLAAVEGMVVLALSYVLYWPFHAHFQQWYLGVDPIKDKSSVWGYFEIHGLFLFAIVGLLIAETARRYGRNGLPRIAGLWLRRWDRLPQVVALQRRLVHRGQADALLAAYSAAAVLILMIILHLMGMTLVALLAGLLLWAVFLALHRDNQPEQLFVLLLIATGLALSIAVEVVAIKGDIGRMNTVFKFYIQVWILWSVALGIALLSTYRHIAKCWGYANRRIWTGWLALLILAALVYPLVATRARVSDRYDRSLPLTLDGTAYMPAATFQEEHPETKKASVIKLGDDLPAMRWLQDNVTGTPVIVEGWAPIYQWGGRYSIYTGLPTVIGWDWHEKQQRWGYQNDVDRRVLDVRTIYGGTSIEQANSLLDKYDVRYVIVGGLERAVYSASGLAKFDSMVGQYLQLVYDSQGVKIYRRL